MRMWEVIAFECGYWHLHACRCSLRDALDTVHDNGMYQVYVPGQSEADPRRRLPKLYVQSDGGEMVIRIGRGDRRLFTFEECRALEKRGVCT